MSSKKLFVLALDGVPFTLLQKLIKTGKMPNLARLAETFHFAQMDSVIPPVSSVAWASFMTGKLPHEHGIWGFVERDPGTMDWYVPRADKLRATTLWEHLSRQNRRVFVMNVPLTTPPRKINGISIGGFLETNLDNATYPPEIAFLLKARGYRIDADTELAKKDLTRFFKHLVDVFEKRVETMWYFWQRESWDFFMLHIMETDRLNHFFWEFAMSDNPMYAPQFYTFYEKIDGFIGQLWNKIKDTHSLLLLSDHGFITLKKEVYLNRWFVEQGYLKFTKAVPETLKDIHPHSKAYSLYPGRIYVNLNGREKMGSVQPGKEYEHLLQHLSDQLLQWKDDDGITQIIKKVERVPTIFKKEKINLAAVALYAEDKIDKYLPDLIAIPQHGYDLKGNLWHKQLFDKTYFNGMHTDDDAFILSAGMPLTENRLSIYQIMRYILEYFTNGNSYVLDD